MSDERPTFRRGDAKECPTCEGYGHQFGSDAECPTCETWGAVCPLCGRGECVSDPMHSNEDDVGEEPTDDTLFDCRNAELAAQEDAAEAARGVHTAYLAWKIRRANLAVQLADLIAAPEGSTLGPASLAARVAYQSHLTLEPPKPKFPPQ